MYFIYQHAWCVYIYTYHIFVGLYVCTYIYACTVLKKSNVDVVLGKFGHLGMIYIFRWTKEIFLLILTSV